MHKIWQKCENNDLSCYINVKSSKDMIVFFSTPEPDEDAGDFLLLGETSPGNMDNLSHRIRVNYNIIIKYD